MRNPIFVSKGGGGRKPILRIKILKLFLRLDEVSKTRAMNLTGSHYADVSNAMKFLAENGFIRYSRRNIDLAPNTTAGHNPENMYVIKPQGLKALLSLNLAYQDFWRAIILYYINRRGANQKEIEKIYYSKEKEIIGYSSKNGYFVNSIKISDLFYLWYNSTYGSHRHDSSNLPSSQILLECLALNRSLSSDELCTASKLSEKAVKNVITARPSNRLQKKDASSSHPTNLPSEFYGLSTFLINQSNSKYELSLLGVMLVLAIIRHFYIGIDDVRHPSDILIGLYNKINLRDYFDKIATNYANKLPLIFGKWDLLKNYLGSLLYDSFDFSMYRNANNNSFESSVTSIMYPGNREFYHDFLAMTEHTVKNLTEFYLAGNDVIGEFRRQDRIPAEEKELSSFMLRLRELQETVALIAARKQLEEFADGNSSSKGMIKLDFSLSRLELIIQNQLTLLFYLNMNISTYLLNRKDSSKSPDEVPVLIEGPFFGNPQFRLKRVLAEDSEVRNWIMDWVDCIIDYRNKSLNVMTRMTHEFETLDKEELRSKLKLNTAQYMRKIPS